MSLMQSRHLIAICAQDIQTKDTKIKIHSLATKHAEHDHINKYFIQLVFTFLSFSFSAFFSSITCSLNLSPSSSP